MLHCFLGDGETVPHSTGRLAMRNGLSAPGMYSVIRHQGLKIPDDKLQRPQTIPLVDSLMSAVAMFSLKHPPLLQFEQVNHNPVERHNIQTLFQVSQIPSDMIMREVLDRVPTSHFQDIFKSLFSLVQRGKALQSYVYLDGHYLLSIVKIKAIFC